MISERQQELLHAGYDMLHSIMENMDLFDMIYNEMTPETKRKLRENLSNDTGFNCIDYVIDAVNGETKY